MPRTRKKIEPSEDQLDFDPNAVAPATANPPQDDFYDSAEHPEDQDGDIPPGSGEDESDGDPSDGQPLGRTTTGMTQGQQAAVAELSDYMRRMSNLIEERNTINADIKELKGEIKGKGYDLKAFDLILKLDNMDDNQKQKRRDQNSVNQTYAHAVGIDEDLL